MKRLTKSYKSIDSKYRWQTNILEEKTNKITALTRENKKIKKLNNAYRLDNIELPKPTLDIMLEHNKKMGHSYKYL